MLNTLFRRFMTSSVLAAISILMVSIAAFASPAASYSFKTLDNQNDPTFNQLLGINDHGVIAGYFGIGSATHPNKGYTLSPNYGQANYKNENFPGSVQTQVTGINNVGDTVGFWVDGNGNNFGFSERNGIFSTAIEPNSTGGAVIFNQLLGINDNGIAVGFYTDANGNNHAYELNTRNGKFAEISVPGATSATATGINNKGDITGFFTAGNGNTVSFLLKNNQFSDFEFNGSTNTTALGINNSDQIVGVYTINGNGAGAGKVEMHGFLLSNPLHHASWQTIDDPNGVGTTTINGLNDNDQLVGFYVDAAGNTDGMLITVKH